MYCDTCTECISMGGMGGKDKRVTDLYETERSMNEWKSGSDEMQVLLEHNRAPNFCY